MKIKCDEFRFSFLKDHANEWMILKQGDAMLDTARSVSSSASSMKSAATALRVLAMDAVEKAQSGHPGMPMGMADVVTVLFSKFMKFDPKNPLWHDRDRFVLSAGHGSILLYSLAYLLGYEEMTLDEIKNFRAWGSITPGHPEVHQTIGVETTTGPLGQGLANAVGMAFAEKLLRDRYTSSLINHRTYAIVGDGCLMEGISQEAISFAGHHQLNKLIVLFDDNHISIDGPTSLTTSDNTLLRFEASNWQVLSVDGHNMDAISKALEEAQASKTRPTLIACRTTIGYGAPTKSGTSAVHGSPLGSAEVLLAKKFLEWEHSPFEIPANVLEAWRGFGDRGSIDYASWQKRFKASEKSVQDSFISQFESLTAEEVVPVTSRLVSQFKQDLPDIATRQSSGLVLDKLVESFPQLLGGSADLTGSNNTKAHTSKPITPDNGSGNYVYYGVREHAMAAMMNGLCLHGGFRPFGGTFLVFSDYCRPAIRLSALMQQPVVYVMTHDSIGLGEDGPTHQPIEHLASLRSIPNLYVFRPADAVEVAECWEIALLKKDAPSLLALTRQKLPLLRREEGLKNLSHRGAYAIHNHVEPRIILIATGSEVSLALKIAEKLDDNKISSRVISMPCTALFDQQDQGYKDELLGKNLTGPVLRVSIEAASSYGWERYVGQEGLALGIDHFGASAPFEEIYRRFGLDIESITTKILNTLKGQ